MWFCRLEYNNGQDISWCHILCSRYRWIPFYSKTSPYSKKCLCSNRSRRTWPSSVQWPIFRLRYVPISVISDNQLALFGRWNGSTHQTWLVRILFVHRHNRYHARLTNQKSLWSFVELCEPDYLNVASYGPGTQLLSNAGKFHERDSIM